MKTQSTNDSTEGLSHFEQALNRLKIALDVKADSDIALILKMPQSTFASQKSRNSFPERALRSLILRQPWQEIDFEYIITGRYSTFEQINQRFKAVTGLKSSAEVYMALGLSGEDFARAKLTNLFPIAALHNFHSNPANKGFDLNYVISGKSVTAEHYGDKLIAMLDKLAILPEELQSPIIESVNLVYDLYKKSTKESPCSN